MMDVIINLLPVIFYTSMIISLISIATHRNRVTNVTYAWMIITSILLTVVLMVYMHEALEMYFRYKPVIVLTIYISIVAVNMMLVGVICGRLSAKNMTLSKPLWRCLKCVGVITSVSVFSIAMSLILITLSIGGTTI